MHPEGRWVGVACHDVHGPPHGTIAENRTLRTPQDFDTLNVEGAHVWIDRQYQADEWHIVHVVAHRLRP